MNKKINLTQIKETFKLTKMAGKKTDVEVWIEREKLHEHIREALENASVSQEAFEAAEAIGREAGFEPKTTPPGWCAASAPDRCVRSWRR